MPATITYTDKEDGTGIDITVAGLVNAPLVIHASLFDGDPAGGAYSPVLTFAADGTQTYAGAVGPYTVTTTENGVPTEFNSFRITDGSEGTHYKCLVAIRDYVMAMNLPLFPTATTAHKLQKKPIHDFTTKTVVGSVQNQTVHGVHYWMLPEDPVPGQNQSKDVTYPVAMVLVRSNGGNNVPHGDWTLSRQHLCQSMYETVLPAVPEIHTVTFDTPQVYWRSSESLNLDLQALIVNCRTEQCFGVN